MDRAQEKALREAAQAAGDDLVIPGSGTEIEPREIKQMLSVRLDPNVLIALRRLARSQDRQTSDLVRDALERYIASEATQPIAVDFDQISFTLDSFNVGVDMRVWNGCAVEVKSRGWTGNLGQVNSTELIPGSHVPSR